LKCISIYTDGACSYNPGPGGYGAVILYKQLRKEISQGYRLTTNNRMEILAAVAALEVLKEPCEVKLYSDSRYLVDAIEKGWVMRWKNNNWMRNKKDKAVNVDLWQRLMPLLSKHSVSFIWVKGHSNNKENEHCDGLARKAIEGELLEDSEYK